MLCASFAALIAGSESILARCTFAKTSDAVASPRLSPKALKAAKASSTALWAVVASFTCRSCARAISKVALASRPLSPSCFANWRACDAASAARMSPSLVASLWSLANAMAASASLALFPKSPNIRMASLTTFSAVMWAPTCMCAGPMRRRNVASLLLSLLDLAISRASVAIAMAVSGCFRPSWDLACSSRAASRSAMCDLGC
mmetsp:Transcript_24529/g.56537  ORF Transcript_24529/g.56537 Transcript_24529/m.56537 type:complete len:203 (+) Transcript_24529:766-1374(+)